MIATRLLTIPSIDLYGKNCCRKRVGRSRSLSVGFGNKVPHSKSMTVDSFYGEWEIGTYSSAWRVTDKGRIICGSSDVVDSVDELDERLQRIEFGSILGIETFSRFDIRVTLAHEICIDFICVSVEDDEIFHIFGPEKFFTEYTFAEGWKTGRSDVPWA